MPGFFKGIREAAAAASVKEDLFFYKTETVGRY